MEYTPQRASARPAPRIRGNQWVVDLRSQGHGSRYVLGPAELDPSEALNRAWELQTRLRGDRMAELAQGDLFGGQPAPKGFAAALDAWHRTKRYDTEHGASYGKDYAAKVRHELGGYDLADFSGPAGTARLRAYVAELERREMSGRTIANRMSVALQVIRFAHGEGWLAHVPQKPKLPPKATPVYRYLTEGMFRQLRAAIYAGASAARETYRGRDRSEPLGIRIARRRCYLSWLFYTGVHRADADHMTAAHLFMDARTYIRVNTKSAACIKVHRDQYEMPEPLYLDLRELERMLGRPFYLDEPVCGGPWGEPIRVINRAAKRLGFPHNAGPAVMRRSYAREMFLRGYSVREVADRMGHVDERMLKEIYVHFPHPAAPTRWRATPESAPSTPNGMARVLQMPGVGGTRK